jgi:hypothetical protein
MKLPPQRLFGRKIMAENDMVYCFKDKLKEVFEIVEEVRAIQTLEYHNKNHLRGSNESRSREQINLLTESLNLLSDIL